MSNNVENSARVDGLEKIMKEKSVEHRRVGNFLFLAAYDAVGCAVNAAPGDYPVIPLAERTDLPDELKDPANSDVIIHFWNLANPLGHKDRVPGFYFSPDTDSVLLALQELDNTYGLEGKTVLDGYARIGEHVILAAKLGAHVSAMQNSDYIWENLGLNSVTGNVMCYSEKPVDVDLSDILPHGVDVVICYSADVGYLLKNVQPRIGFISWDAHITKDTFEASPYNHITAVNYYAGDKSSALICTRPLSDQSAVFQDRFRIPGPNIGGHSTVYLTDVPSMKPSVVSGNSGD